MAKLKAADLNAWRDDVVGEHDDPDQLRRAQDTCNRVWSELRAALNAAFRASEDTIPTDKAWRSIKPFADVGRAREVHFNEAELQRLIQHARALSPALGDLVTAGALTGMRSIGEVHPLNGGQLRRACGRAHGRPRQDRARAVVLQAEAVAFFTRLAAGRAADEPLLRQDNGARWTKDSQTKLMRAAIRAAGLPEAASFYTLRHSYITACVEGGVPLAIIAANVGNSVAMIEKHYEKVIALKRVHLFEAGAPKLGLTP